jgi:hypothetical protein
LIHIVGCNHGIQVGRSGLAALDPANQNEQRERFTAMLEDICSDQAIEIILEENGAPEETAGEQIARQRNIPWVDINTSTADKERLGIPAEYLTGPYTADQRSDWNRQRELFMLGKIAEHRRRRGMLLIICGFEHLQTLTELLNQDGSVVQPWDYRRLGWYRDGIFAGDP